MSENNEITGSTMLPSATLAPSLVGKQVRADELYLSGTKADGITADYNSQDVKKLASILAVHNASAELLSSINEVARDLNDFYFRSVLSDPLAAPNFSDLSRWSLSNFFFIDNSNAICLIKSDVISDEQATLKLITAAFTNPGTHYVDMTVDQLPAGGIITVRNESEVVKVLTGAGRYRFEFKVNNPTTTYLEFVVGNVQKGYSVIIESISVYCIKTSFESYMEYMSGKLLSGGSGFASIDDINTAINRLDLSLREYVNVVMDGNLGLIHQHIADTTSNPHNITPALIKAATVIHKHVLADITGLDSVMSDVTQSLDAVTRIDADFLKHLNAVNPHGITPELITAAKEVHRHETDEINGLPELNDTLTAFMSSTEAQFTNIITQMGSSQSDATVVASMLRAHELATGNVHKAVPADFGIEFATTAEARDGTDNTKYMTPALVQESINDRAADPGVNVNKLSPFYIGRFVLSTNQKSVNIPITAGGRYQFVLSGQKQFDLRKVSLSLNGTISAITTPVNVRNTVIEGTTLVGESTDTLRFLPSNSKFTTMFGTYDFSTDTGVLRGRGVGYTLNSSFNSVGTCEPVDVSAVYDIPVQFLEADLLTITISEVVTGAAIIIDMYELMPANTHPVITDALKAGTIIERFGSVACEDYSLFDGSVLNRIRYADLWKEVNQTGPLISLAEWTAEVAANGYCEKFHTGDGVTTFGLPKVAISLTTNRYIKLTSAKLPDPAQVMYQFVWD